MIIEVHILTQSGDGAFVPVSIGVHNITYVTDALSDEDKKRCGAIIITNTIDYRSEKPSNIMFMVQETRDDINALIKGSVAEFATTMQKQLDGVTWTDRKKKPEHLHVVDEEGAQ